MCAVLSPDARHQPLAHRRDRALLLNVAQGYGLKTPSGCVSAKRSCSVGFFSFAMMVLRKCACAAATPLPKVKSIPTSRIAISAPASASHRRTTRPARARPPSAVGPMKPKRVRIGRSRGWPIVEAGRDERAVKNSLSNDLHYGVGREGFIVLFDGS